MDSQVEVAATPLRVLKVMGFSHKNTTFWTVLKLICVLLYYHTVTIGMWGHVVYHVLKYRSGEKPFNFEDIGDDASGIMSSYLAFYFELVYFMQCHRMEELLRDVGDFANYEKPDDFERITKLSDKWSGILLRFLYASMAGLWVFSLFQNCEDGVVDDCGLMITVYMPFDVFYTPARQITCALQTSSAFSSAIATTNITLILIFCTQSLVLQVRHLRKMLLKISKMGTRRERKAQIKKCVLYHYRILRINKAFSKEAEPFFFALVFLASVIISLLSYQLIVLKLKYVTVVHLGTYLICTGFACLFGELLITEGENLFNTLYDSIPLDGDMATTKDLYLMMMMAIKDLYMEAGKFGPVGHIRFMLMIKGTYSFLTLFLNV